MDIHETKLEMRYILKVGNKCKHYEKKKRNRRKIPRTGVKSSALYKKFLNNTSNQLTSDEKKGRKRER